jgi:hypothetical protein
MKLLNVRLGPEDARMVARLQEQGLPISSLVRDAIRAAYKRQRTAAHSGRRAREIMADIYREHPDPLVLRSRRRDLRNRRKVRREIRARLRRPRS